MSAQEKISLNTSIYLIQRYVILYYKSNLVYTGFFRQFLIFQQNNSAQTSALIFYTSRHYYFVEKFKIMERNLCKLNYSYGKVSHTLKDNISLNQIKKLTKQICLNQTVYQYESFFGSKKVSCCDVMVVLLIRCQWYRRVVPKSFNLFIEGSLTFR